MVSVEGRSLGKVTSLALLQSTYSVLSFPGDSQKALSLASLANLGMGFHRLGLICLLMGGTALSFRLIERAEMGRINVPLARSVKGPMDFFCEEMTERGSGDPRYSRPGGRRYSLPGGRRYRTLWSNSE